MKFKTVSELLKEFGWYTSDKKINTIRKGKYVDTIDLMNWLNQKMDECTKIVKELEKENASDYQPNIMHYNSMISAYYDVFNLLSILY